MPTLKLFAEHTPHKNTKHSRFSPGARCRCRSLPLWQLFWKTESCSKQTKRSILHLVFGDSTTSRTGWHIVLVSVPRVNSKDNQPHKIGSSHRPQEYISCPSDDFGCESNPPFYTNLVTWVFVLATVSQRNFGEKVLRFISCPEVCVIFTCKKSWRGRDGFVLPKRSNQRFGYKGQVLRCRRGGVTYTEKTSVGGGVTHREGRQSKGIIEPKS